MMESNNNSKKCFLIRHQKIIEICCSIISVVIIGFSGVYISIKANIIATEQIAISKMAMTPYFDITSNNEGSKQIAYKIRNEGGYIQNAHITLKSIIGIYIRNFGGEDFYFPYEILSNHYSDLKSNEIIIEFNELSFGIENWNFNDQAVTNRIIDKLEDKKIHASINYMEYIDIEYMDFNRTVNKETYLIGMRDDGTLFLSQITNEMSKSIQSKIPENFYTNSIQYADGTIKQIGSSGGGGSSGRGIDSEAIFVSKIVDEIDKYIEKINNNLKDQ